MVSSEIDSSDYRIIKAACEKKIAVLESKLFDRSSSDDNIDHLLEKAVNVIGKLDCLFVDCDIKKKRQILGSIFPEKLIFDGNNYRTERLIVAIDLIYSMDKGFSGKKMDKTMKISICPNKLPDLDSNQDNQNQNLKYYHYTIGQ